MTFPVSERSSLSYHHQGLGAVRFLTAGEEKICYCIEVGVNFLDYVRFFHMYRTCWSQSAGFFMLSLSFHL